jgi:hypothetical protein
MNFLWSNRLYRSGPRSRVRDAIFILMNEREIAMDHRGGGDPAGVRAR